MQNLRHYVIMAVLVVVVAILTYLGLDALGLMPVAAAAQAGPIDWLFDLQVKAISFFFALIIVPMGYSLVVFRRRKGETGDGDHIEGNSTLEVVWTFIPLVLVVVLGYIGADNLARIRQVDPQAVEIKVVGFQWSWRFEYPQGFVSNTLYLPVDKQVVLKMESSDVLHSFWVPEFRVKQDLVPGRVEEYRITPTLLGDYKVRCAEICGTSHSYMESPIKVVSQADYDSWVNEQAAIAAAEAAASAGIPIQSAARNCTTKAAARPAIRWMERRALAPPGRLCSSMKLNFQMAPRLSQMKPILSIQSRIRLLKLWRGIHKTPCQVLAT